MISFECSSRKQQQLIPRIPTDRSASRSTPCRRRILHPPRADMARVGVLAQPHQVTSVADGGAVAGAVPQDITAVRTKRPIRKSTTWLGWIISGYRQNISIPARSGTSGRPDRSAAAVQHCRSNFGTKFLHSSDLPRRIPLRRVRLALTRPNTEYLYQIFAFWRETFTL
jgi:hypothetical protein